MATTFPVPSSSKADSSRWPTDQLPPPSTPMRLLQDLPGRAVAGRDPRALAGPGPRAPRPLALQRSLSAPPSGDPRDAAGAGKFNPNSEPPHPGTKPGKGWEVNAFPPKPWKSGSAPRKAPRAAIRGTSLPRGGLLARLGRTGSLRSPDPPPAPKP